MALGSIVNKIQARAHPQEPKIGMGVTLLLYTDRKAGTIRDVSVNGKSFLFTLDKAIRTDFNGMSDSQTYEYEDQPNTQTYEAVKTKSGVWKVKRNNDNPGLGGTIVAVGYRDHYHDYSF